ncbi:MAG: AAA family ATPase [Deltaproteobacteria bacterium]|nr:AAA family ATPase [Deltaproteobacteria bacterium]
MYLAFYGLQTKPFELLPDPRFLYVSRGHDLALTHLEYGILENKALIALTGDVGTGKTTLFNYLLKKLKTDFSSAVIVNPHVDPTEFLAVVLRQFGENADDHRKSLLFDNIHRFLLNQLNHGRRSVLLIDEAQNLPLDTLEEVRMLSNLHTEDRHLIQIVLAGQPQLQRRLPIEDKPRLPLPKAAAVSSSSVPRREMSPTAAPATPKPAPASSRRPIASASAPPQGAVSDFAFTETAVSEPQYSQTRNVSLNRKQLLERRVFSILSKNRVADQYKLLRTVLLNKTRSFGYNTILVTSFKEKEGKSLTSINLSITLATESSQTVLLVDMDLRRPAVHKILGIKEGPGLKDYFLNNVPLKNILVHPDIEALTVLPAGGRMDNSTEIIGSYRTEELVREIKSRYPDRYVIFDTPALNNCPDALVLASYVDAIVVVARANFTSGEDLTNCMGLLKEKNVVGVVLNRGDVRKEWAY